jgi:septal ring factor EnvC (AmiA/AmiB activator)
MFLIADTLNSPSSRRKLGPIRFICNRKSDFACLVSILTMAWIPAFAWMTAFLLFMPSAHASNKQTLTELQSKLQTERQQQDTLKQQLSTAQGDFESTRKNLITLSHDLQSNEKTLSALEDKITKLQTEESALNTKMQSDYGSMGNLILALERIRRMPTETLIIRPGAPLETAESAILLRSILPGINARADQMAKDVKQLQSVRKTLEDDKTKALKTAQDLKDQKKDLQAMLDKRAAFYKQTKSAYDDQSASVAKIAAEAQSLEQLVSKIKEQPQEPSRRLSSFRIPGGSWIAPVQGKIMIHFGQRDQIGAASEGLRISGRSGALVTAPVSGIVRYAGSFRSYGNMVIIEHAGDLHSLISGLSRIDARVGENISAGEPVGTLPATGADGPPTLYYELRHNGKPVDPSTKFPDLS